MKISEKGKIEEMLYAYAEKNETAVDKEKIRETVKRSREAFFAGEEARKTSYMEFIFQQSRFIRKIWWLLQLIVVAALYVCLCSAGSEYTMQRAMGAAAPLLVIMIVPELWKNRGSMSMEIEGSAYYSLRQVYSARLTVFAFADGILLTLFFVFAFATTRIEAEEMMVQFMLPMIVTCCICLRMLCSRFVSSEYMAVFLSLLWTGFWLVVVIDRGIYDKISGPVWAGICALAMAYFVYVVRKTVIRCDSVWEVNNAWN